MAGVNFLYYCSLDDVKDALLNAVKDWAVTTLKLSDPKIRGHIRRAYAELNGAMAKGGYTVPAVNATKTTITGAVTATEDATATAEIVGDGTGFAAGDTVRVHGLLTGSTVYKDEFVGLVVVSGNALTFERFENAYDAGATVELCTEGFVYLNSCNTTGAAYKTLASITVGQARAKNDRVDELKAKWDECLKALKQGEVILDGLALGSANVAIESFQTNNADDLGVTSGPRVTLTKDW